MTTGQKLLSHLVSFLCAFAALILTVGASPDVGPLVGLSIPCFVYFCMYRLFKFRFEEDNKDKASKTIKGHGFGTTFLPEERKFILVGLKHEGREAFVRDNKDEIEARAVLDRKQFADKDPNVVGLALDGTICGFISAQYAQFIAPVVDQFGEDIHITPRVWIGENGKVRIYMKVWALKKAAKEALAKAFKQCASI